METHLQDKHFEDKAEWEKERLSLKLSLNNAEQKIEQLQRDLKIERDRRSKLPSGQMSDYGKDKCDTDCKAVGSKLSADVIRHCCALNVVFDIYPKMMIAMIKDSVPSVIKMGDPGKELLEKLTLDKYGYSIFDTAYIYKLIRNNLNLFQSPSNNIKLCEKMRCDRNCMCHKPKMGLTEEEFEAFFTGSIQIAMHMDGFHGKCDNGFKQQIESIKHTWYLDASNPDSEGCTKYQAPGFQSVGTGSDSKASVDRRTSESSSSKEKSQADSKSSDIQLKKNRGTRPDYFANDFKPVHGRDDQLPGLQNFPLRGFVQTPEEVADNKCMTCGSEYNCLLERELETQRLHFEEKMKQMEQDKQEEYNCLLERELETQRLHFEEKMRQMEQDKQEEAKQLDHRIQKETENNEALQSRLNNSEKEKEILDKKCNNLHSRLTKVISELQEESQMNKCLLENQQVWQKKVQNLESQVKDLTQEIKELKEQLRDVMFYLEARQKLSSSTEISPEEIQDSKVIVGASGNTPSPTARRGRKKNR